MYMRDALTYDVCLYKLLCIRYSYIGGILTWIVVIHIFDHSYTFLLIRGGDVKWSWLHYLEAALKGCFELQTNNS